MKFKEKDEEGCGRMWTDVEGCGRMWKDVEGCEKDVEGCEKDVEGCGRMWKLSRVMLKIRHCYFAWRVT